jgi:phosphatidylethanolamine-binding protein (PEBP) family uncharacterized protein
MALHGTWTPLLILFLVVGTLFLLSQVYPRRNNNGISTASFEVVQNQKSNPTSNASPQLMGSSSVTEQSSSFLLTSPMFASGDNIPIQYTCTDANGNTQNAISPPLEWTGAPSGTVQYLIVMSTVNGDATTYDWAVYDIPPEVSAIPENGSETVGKIGGTNPDFLYEYRGPCASTSGVHEYHIKVYALSSDLNAVVEKGDAKSYPPHLINAVALRKWVLAEASMSVNYCRCGCDGSIPAGETCA